jgi:hypothetical protein
MSMKKSSDTIGPLTCDLPACNAVNSLCANIYYSAEEVVLATSWASIREISVLNLEQDLLRWTDCLKAHQPVDKYLDTGCV